MTSKQRRNFPVPIGVIMLPLLLVSALGIIVFGFNIFFVNQQAAASSANLQNRTAWADSAYGNSSSTASILPAAEAKNQKKNAAPVGLKPSVNDVAKIDAAKVDIEKAETKNVELAVPVGGIRSKSAGETDPFNVGANSEVRSGQLTVAKKTVNERLSREVKQVADRGQVKTAKTEPVKKVVTNISTQNWQIQAGAFSLASSAAQIRKKIVPFGYDVKIVRTETAKPLSKVMVSPGKSRDAPRDALKKLNSIGIDGYIISGRS